jgi:hypothetical protein
VSKREEITPNTLQNKAFGAVLCLKEIGLFGRIGRCGLFGQGVQK